MLKHDDKLQYAGTQAPPPPRQRGAEHFNAAASGRSMSPPPPIKWPGITHTAQPQMAMPPLTTR
jgi:hypothetical protein